jgi:bla regulator protein blaR1
MGVIALASLTGAWGQSSSQAFEVASVKPSRSGGGESNFDSRPGGRLTATNVSLRELIRLAFGVRDYQIARAPGWIDTARYDIDAKTGSAGNAGDKDISPLLRHLLADRFRLTAHRETRELRVYALAVGKNGPRLIAHNDGSGARTRTGCGHLAGTRLTMDVLATVLSRQFECDVLNRTGLAGKYDFELDWTPEAGPCATAAESGEPSVRPSIFTALQEQLGLKLESTMGPIEVLIIDHVEKPSGN